MCVLCMYVCIIHVANSGMSKNMSSLDAKTSGLTVAGPEDKSEKDDVSNKRGSSEVDLFCLCDFYLSNQKLLDVRNVC